MYNQSLIIITLAKLAAALSRKFEPCQFEYSSARRRKGNSIHYSCGVGIFLCANIWNTHSGSRISDSARIPSSFICCIEIGIENCLHWFLKFWCHYCMFLQKTVPWPVKKKILKLPPIGKCGKKLTLGPEQKDSQVCGSCWTQPNLFSSVKQILTNLLTSTSDRPLRSRARLSTVLNACKNTLSIETFDAQVLKHLTTLL